MQEGPGICFVSDWIQHTGAVRAGSLRRLQLPPTRREEELLMAPLRARGRSPHSSGAPTAGEEAVLAPPDWAHQPPDQPHQGGDVFIPGL